MNFIETEISQKQNKYKLLKQKVDQQKETITILRKQNDEYQKTIFDLKNTLLEKEQNNKRIPQELQLKIQKVIDEKLYLQKDISLTTLAKKICTNRTYLSRYINKEYSSFYNFLNIFRIAEACHILKNEKYIVLKTLYECIGYKSQNTFYRAFSGLKKMTPREFLYSYNKYKN